MLGLLSESEKSGIRATFEQSFDTWSRQIIVYKEPTKTAVATSNNVFGFGEIQQDTAFTVTAQQTCVFPAVLKDADIESPKAQAGSSALSPEIMARIVAYPLSIKVRRDCRDFINNGKTEKIVDVLSSKTYLLDGADALQTYGASEYYIFPLRRTQ